MFCIARGMPKRLSAAAQLDGHPLAAQPGRLRQAAAEIAENHPGASPDDVLLWAEARALPAACRGSLSWIMRLSRVCKIRLTASTARL